MLFPERCGEILNNTGGQETPTRNGLPQRVWLICKWVIPVVALLYLWREGVFAPGTIRLTPAIVGNLAIAVCLIVVATLAVSLRFHCLLGCLGIKSTAGKQLRLNFPGLLIQQFASEAAFDGMRILAAKKMGGKNAVVLAALMADRLLGLLALTTMAVAGLAWFWKDSGWMYGAALPLAVIVMLPCGFIVANLLHEKQYSWFHRIPGSAFVASIGSMFGVYRHHAPILIGLFCSSCLTHLCLFAALYFCGQSLEHAPPTLAESIVGGVVSSFTGILPLPMAGLGVGETAFGETIARMRGHSQVASYAGVFLINRILIFGLGVVSWLVAAVVKEKA